MNDKGIRASEPEENIDPADADNMSEDEMLEAVASGKISGCQAFRTLAASVKKEEDRTK